MSIITIASWCAAITTITGTLVTVYKVCRNFEKKFDDINQCIKDAHDERKEELKNVNDTMMTLNNNMIDAFNNNVEEVNKAFQKVNDKIDEDTLLTLKIAIMSPNLDVSEKLHYGELYTRLGGNGSVGAYLNELRQKYNDTHFRNESINN